LKENETSYIEKTQKFFLKKFGESLTKEDARQVNERVRIVFGLLAKWDREQSVSPQSETETEILSII